MMTVRTTMSRAELVSVIVTATLFFAAIIGTEHYRQFFQDATVLKGAWGMVLYVVLAVAATIVAPVSTVPLVPVAATLWGPFLTALLSILGWTVGAIGAFLIARSAGVVLVRKILPIEKARAVASRIVGPRPFLSILILRMLVPVDVLSYAVGLFVPIPLGRYTLATVLGVTPFAFIFAYVGTLPQGSALGVFAFALCCFFVWRYRERRSAKQ